MIQVSCPKCPGKMELRLLRPDPHEPAEKWLVCECGYREEAAADIRAHDAEHPRMPGS